MMRLSCSHCSAPLEAANVDLRSGFARCTACGSVLRLSSLAEDAPAQAARAPAPRPASVQVEEGMGAVTFRMRWFSFKYLFFAFFCVVWNGFLVFWYFLAFQDGLPLVVKVFPLLHVAAGVWLTYSTLAGFLNTTVLRLDRGELSVRHGPLPWPGTQRLPVHSLSQLYCEEKVTRTRNGPSHSYGLSAVLTTGEKRKLLGGLDSADVPRYFEHALEERMGIQDRPVAGALR